ncbi:hypothetical protein ACCT03_00160 [Rhizobium johnstonii]|uniref:hypothetical protein n=1 Tax=Rhizobium TaxID=379 RepID=UPI0010300FA3|nr:hypothetical protein [Rhizobium leguminosarum]NKL64891.1 hypothetical protein [Rhizobium leguminosarum bv. viciae]TBF83176.1 hypothetical protein ELG86_14065 [Rhizobium leguminosarum]TBH02625.1 hypothetical protein ELG70_13825 [Rhizobium leguminosarum]TBH12071.1 hypothetical protein ELG68_13460 [Rhizobium leguminosarum]TBH37120.1 hypothetical protein ELG66_15410 [Rhizobium leguminosarum]
MKLFVSMLVGRAAGPPDCTNPSEGFPYSFDISGPYLLGFAGGGGDAFAGCAGLDAEVTMAGVAL